MAGQRSRRALLRRLGGLAAAAGANAAAGCLGGVRSPGRRRSPEPPTVEWRRVEREEGRVHPSAMAAADGAVALAGATHPRDGDRDDWSGWLQAYDGDAVRWSHRGNGDHGRVATDVVSAPAGFVYAGARLDGEGRPADVWLVGVDPDGEERWTATVDVGGYPSLAAPDGGPVFVVAGAHEEDEGSIVAVNDRGEVTERRTLEGATRDYDAVAEGDRLLVAGRAPDDGTVAVLVLGADGQLRERRTYGGEDLPHPSPVFADDGSALAVNAITGAFAASAELLGLADDGSVSWRRQFEGWHVAAMPSPAGWPDDGVQLVVANDAGENPPGEGGAPLFAADDSGGTHWIDDGPFADRDPPWKLRAAVAVEDGVLVAGDVRDGETGPDLGVAHLVAADS